MRFPIKRRVSILALGAESVGVFTVYKNGDIFVSENFGDLLDETSFLNYRKAVSDYFKRENIKPDVIITDLHPFFKTTVLGEELAKKYKAPHIKIQHHLAHIFSSTGDFILNTEYLMPNTFFGIAMDGTGYGLDGNIWGGEVFKIQSPKTKNQNYKSKAKTELKQNLMIERVGSLEEQIMIGGDLAIREPARMIIAILTKLKTKNEKLKTKNDIYQFVNKYYSRNEFELLYNQLEQGFNCQITTSTGRILDAVSVLLGFAGNERNFKHEATKKLEKNSTAPYNDLDLRFSAAGGKVHSSRIILDTTYLFEYLIKNIHRDKRRLAATAQQYIAAGFYEIIKKNYKSLIVNRKSCIVAAGGMTNNRIISSYLESRCVYLSKKIPRGDEGIAMGQLVYYLLNKI